MHKAMVKVMLVAYFADPRVWPARNKAWGYISRMSLWLNKEICWCCTVFLWDLIKDIKSEKQIMFCLGKFISEATFLPIFFPLLLSFLLKMVVGVNWKFYGQNNHAEMITKSSVVWLWGLKRSLKISALLNSDADFAVCLTST